MDEIAKVLILIVFVLLGAYNVYAGNQVENTVPDSAFKYWTEFITAGITFLSTLSLAGVIIKMLVGNLKKDISDLSENIKQLDKDNRSLKKILEESIRDQKSLIARLEEKFKNDDKKEVELNAWKSDVEKRLRDLESK